MCEKFEVRESPETTGRVGHCINGPRNVMVAREVSMVALMERTETEKICASVHRGR